jgi:hypothetical protein
VFQIVQKFGDNSNTINDKAVLEIGNQRFFTSRMTKTQRGLINNPPEGLMLVYGLFSSKGSEIVVWVKIPGQGFNF